MAKQFRHQWLYMACTCNQLELLLPSVSIRFLYRCGILKGTLFKSYLSDPRLVRRCVRTIQRYKRNSFSTFLTTHARSFSLPNLGSRHLNQREIISSMMHVAFLFCYIKAKTELQYKTQGS